MGRVVDDAAPGLYVVYLGGNLTPGRLGEDHEVVLVVAESDAAARKVAKKKWRGAGRPHVDAVQRIRVIDGHEVSLSPVDLPDHLELDPTYSP